MADADTQPSGSALDLKAEKKRLRQAALEQRAKAAQAATNGGPQLCTHLLAEIDIPAGAVVSAYWPMRDEIDPRPTLEALHDRGHPIGLPAMPAKAQPLEFRAWTPGAALEDGGFGTQVPRASAAVVTPQVLLVPLLAFDRAGYRLGYGGGFYDRTLAGLRAARPTAAIGLAYAAQRAEALPREPTDIPLDSIATEQGLVRPEA